MNVTIDKNGIVRTFNMRSCEDLAEEIALIKKLRSASKLKTVSCLSKQVTQGEVEVVYGLGSIPWSKT